MRRRWAAAALAVAAALLACGCTGDPLDDRIESSEDIVRAVQEEASRLYAARADTVADCECSVHACGHRFRDSLVCTDKLGVLEGCSGCDVEGMRLDMNRTHVETPPGSDPDALTDEVIESICTYQSIDDTIVATGPDGKYTWTYIGTTTGVMRIWPGQPRARGAEEGSGNGLLGNCRPYDPRIRPWFISASSGPKDVVILLDTSGSMNMPIGDGATNRWDVAREAVTSLLGTFGIADFAAVVTFNSKALALGGSKSLVRLDNDNLEFLTAQLETVVPASGTDFRVGFDLAFDLLIESTIAVGEEDEARTSGCIKVILFLTDGEDCSVNERQGCEAPEPRGAESGPDLVLDRIAERQAELAEVGGAQAHVFTFSMTSDADDKLPKMIACENEGSWSAIDEQDDPLFKFLDYSRFLAWGRQTFDVIWSSFYVDDAGLGNMTTAAMPIYSPMTGDGIPGLLVGVVGKDVLVSQLQADDKDFKAVFERIIERTSICREAELNACQFQVLRGKKAECPDVLPRVPCYYLQSSGAFFTTDPSNKLSYGDADLECIAMGGRLAEFNSREEQMLVSGLASRGGSWIGLTLRTDETPSAWRWTQSGDEVEDPFRSFDGDEEEGPEGAGGQGARAALRGRDVWSMRAEDREDCAAVDRRGIRHNVEDVDCDKKMTYVCEFDEDTAPDVCKGTDVLVINRRYEPMVPAISECRDYETALAASTQVVEATRKVRKKKVLCPFGGRERTTKEVQCCCSDVGCVQQDDSPCTDRPLTGN